MTPKVLSVFRILLLLAVSAPAAAQYQSTPAPPPPPPPPAPGVPAASATDMHIIPKNGQSEEQLWNDRYACHNWAQGQSGFDPAHAASMPAAEAASRREQYQQDMVACMDNRGYAVQFGAAVAAAAPAVVVVPHTNVLRYHPLIVDIAGGYTFARGDTTQTLQDGGTGSLGLTWFPSSNLPLGIRFEGSYSYFNTTLNARNLASIATGTDVAEGHTQMYGGNIDARLDLAHRSSKFGMYLFAGFGRFRTQTQFKQVTPERGFVCWLYCYPAYVLVESTVSQTTSEWRKSWNAGFGMEWALNDPVRFFIEGRYMRVAPYDQNNTFIPVQIGLRF
jgi:opacity protein-like surface antigen